MASLVGILLGVSMYSTSLLLPLFLEDFLEHTALQAAVIMLPGVVLTGAIAPLVGNRCCIASVSHKAVGQNVCCLRLAHGVQSAPDLLRREWRVDVPHPDTGERVHDSISHGHGCRHRR
jgi:hypothetical protein